MWCHAASAPKQRVKHSQNTFGFQSSNLTLADGPDLPFQASESLQGGHHGVSLPGHLGSAFSGRLSHGHKYGLNGDKRTGCGSGGGPSPDLSLPQTRSPQPVCWAQHGLAQPLTTHLDLTWTHSLDCGYRLVHPCAWGCPLWFTADVDAS